MRERPRPRRADDVGPIEAEVVVNAGGCSRPSSAPGRRAHPGGPLRPRVPRHPALPRAGARRAPAHAPRPRQPRLLPRGGRGPRHGRLRAAQRPWALDDHGVDRIPPDFNGRLLEEDWPRFEELAERSRLRVPAMADVRVTRLINGPEAFTPDNEFCLGETEVGRPLRGGGLLRARAGGRRRGGAGHGRLDPRRRGPRGRLRDGRPAVRDRLPVARVHAGPRPRDLRDVLRHRVPRARAAGRPAPAAVERVSLARRARRVLRREGGLGARELLRRQRRRRRRRRGAAAPRLGRPPVVARDRGRAPRRRGAGRASSTSRRSPSSRSPARGPRPCSRAPAPTTSCARPGA